MKKLMLILLTLSLMLLANPKGILALDCPGGVERINPITNLPYCDGTTDPNAGSGTSGSGNSSLGKISFPSELQTLSPSNFLNSLVGLIISIAGVLFFFLLLWGGLRYMLAGGDPKNTESARKILTSALIGLLIVVGAYFITIILGSILGYNNILSPTIPGLK